MNLLDVEIADHIAVVRLNRPASRNALNAELVVRLAETWEGLSADADVRVIVLTGTGESTFCAGFDLASLIPLITGTRAPADAWDEAVQAGGGLALAGRATLRDCDPGRPIIVAANGHAIAGGFELLLAGDLRIVAAGARLGLSEVRLGLIPAMGGTARLARQMPPALAAEMLLTGNPVSAERALAAGFLNRVAPAAEVMNIAMEYARVSQPTPRSQCAPRAKSCVALPISPSGKRSILKTRTARPWHAHRTQWKGHAPLWRSVLRSSRAAEPSQKPESSSDAHKIVPRVAQ